ncbi:hypothetical protein DAPPUDRAFT_299878 [Daphnia pulex]|uniref:Uncharacterized protein n=1 Tax=Daphnia pulex TaxID=6669 RepID=E9FQS2_DAPPU|nr:hypothetical protein DAPPUDRAFT_299878 [Daphnia pulex]|eukprot:EFX90038.1 hypothetical protein DAPPUDRAFT_299878 [Daphnia pulex]
MLYYYQIGIQGDVKRVDHLFPNTLVPLTMRRPLESNEDQGVQTVRVRKFEIAIALSSAAEITAHHGMTNLYTNVLLACQRRIKKLLTLPRISTPKPLLLL